MMSGGRMLVASAFALMLLAAAAPEGACNDGACTAEHTDELNLMQKSWPKTHRAHRAGRDINLAAKKSRRDFGEFAEEPDYTDAPLAAPPKEMPEGRSVLAAEVESAEVEAPASEVSEEVSTESAQAIAKPLTDFVGKLTSEADTVAEKSAEEARAAAEKAVAAVMARESAIEYYNTTLAQHAKHETNEKDLKKAAQQAAQKVQDNEKSIEKLTMDVSKATAAIEANKQQEEDITQRQTKIKMENKAAEIAAQKGVEAANNAVTAQEANIQKLETQVKQMEVDLQQAKQDVNNAENAKTELTTQTKASKAAVKLAVEEKGKFAAKVTLLDANLAKAHSQAHEQMQAVEKAQMMVTAFKVKAQRAPAIGDAQLQDAKEAEKKELDKKYDVAVEEVKAAETAKQGAEDDMAQAEAAFNSANKATEKNEAKLAELPKALAEATDRVGVVEKKLDTTKDEMSKAQEALVKSNNNVTQTKMAGARVIQEGKKSVGNLEQEMKQVQAAKLALPNLKPKEKALRDVTEWVKTSRMEADKAASKHAEVIDKLSKVKLTLEDAEKNKEAATIEATAASKIAARTTARAESDAEKAATGKAESMRMSKAAVDMVHVVLSKQGKHEQVVLDRSKRSKDIAKAQSDVEQIEAQLEKAKEVKANLDEEQQLLGIPKAPREGSMKISFD